MVSILATHYGEKREDFAPVPKCGRIVLATCFAVAAASGEAVAQGDMGICTVAKTCSEAFFQCVATRCPAIQNPNCTAACKLQFDDCRRTGEFGGRDCRGKTLLRK
jgi:hypothetical protein